MALKKDGVYDQLYTTRRSPNSPQILSDLEVAILGAGGMEHWGGFAMLYWLTGVVLLFSGIGIMFYEPRKLSALGSKCMHLISGNHIKMLSSHVTEILAIVFSLPAWGFIIALMLFWSPIGDYLSQFLNFIAFAVVCWVCGSASFLLFVRLAEDSPNAVSGRIRFWLLFSGTSIVLLPPLVCLNYIIHWHSWE